MYLHQIGRQDINSYCKQGQRLFLIFTNALVLIYGSNRMQATDGNVNLTCSSMLYGKS